MRIVNLTPFDSARLREIARLVADRELDPNHRNGITIHFVTAKARDKRSRKARSAGFYRRIVLPIPSGLKYNQAIVTIPRKPALANPERAAMNAALLLAHEFAEMRGLAHVAMRTPRYFFRDNWQEHYEWAKALPLVLAPVAPKPVGVVVAIDNFARKLQHCMTRRAICEAKEKRAATLRKKWDRKVKYYERKVKIAQSTASAQFETQQTSEVA